MNESIEQQLQSLAADMYEQNNELASMLAAQRVLLEIAFANNFINDPDGFDELMQQLLQQTLDSPVVPEGVPEHMVLKQQVRLAKHLQRFQQSVSARLR